MQTATKPANRRAARRAAPFIVALAGATAMLIGWSGAAQAAPPPRNSLVIDAGVDALYESNVLRLTGFPGATGGNSENDIRITPSISVDLHHVFGLTSVDLTGSAGYDFYTRNKFLDATRVNLAASSTTAIGRCHLSPTVSLSLGQTDVGDLGVAIGNSTLSQYYSVTADCRRPVGLYPSVTGFFSSVSNSDDTRKVFDVHTYGVSGGIGYTVPSLGDVLLSGGISRISRPHHAAGFDDSTEVKRASITVSRSVSSRLSASVSASYVDANPKLATVRGFRGLGYSGRVTYIPTSRFSITGSFSRDIQGDGTFGSVYELADVYSLGASLVLTARSRIFANADLNKRVLRGEPSLPPPFRVRRRDDTRDIGGGYEYNIREKWFFTLRASYVDRDSENSFFDYSSTSISLGVRTRL